MPSECDYHSHSNFPVVFGRLAARRAENKHTAGKSQLESEIGVHPDEHGVPRWNTAEILTLSLQTSSPRNQPYPPAFETAEELFHRTSEAPDHRTVIEQRSVP